MARGSGRNDAAIVEAFTAVAQAVVQSQGNGGHGHQDPREAEERRLDRFMRNNPPTFKGRFNPEGALTWTEGLERIFRAMVTSDDQKVSWLLTCLLKRLSTSGQVPRAGLRLVVMM